MDILHKYFSNLTELQIAQFSQLGELYSEWNDKINVVSRKDIEELYQRHVLHSLAIAKVVSFKDGSSILDVGTGGGFPGIPLAILFPNCKFHLVDSIGKKIKVVNELVMALGLTNVKAEQKRAEEVKAKFDFVVSRAVTAMPRFIEWVTNKFKDQDVNAIPNGIIALKGGDLDEELAQYKRYCTIHEIADFFEEPFFETKKVVHLPI